MSNSDRPALFGSCAARVSNADVSVLSAVVRVMLGLFIHDRGRFWQRSRDSGFCLFGLEKKAPSLETCAREYLVASGYVTHGAVIITMVAALCVCLLLQIQSNAAPPPATATTSPQEAEKKTSAPAAGRSNSTRPGRARGTDDACKRQWRGSRTLAGPPSPTLSVASYHDNDKQTVGLAQLHSSLGHFGGDLQPVKASQARYQYHPKGRIGPARVLRAAPSSPRQFPFRFRLPPPAAAIPSSSSLSLDAGAGVGSSSSAGKARTLGSIFFLPTSSGVPSDRFGPDPRGIGWSFHLWYHAQPA